jgi:hypothetical protein
MCLILCCKPLAAHTWFKEHVLNTTLLCILTVFLLSGPWAKKTQKKNEKDVELASTELFLLAF